MLGQTIVDLLRRDGPMSRATIARHCSVSKPTVSTVVHALLASQLIVERGRETASRGRPGRLLAFNEDAGFVVGLDVGGTTTRAVLADLAGKELGRYREATVQGSVEGLVNQIASIVDRLAGKADGTGRVVGVGLGTPGVVNAEQRCFTVAPNIPALETNGILDQLITAVGVPLTVLNDVNAAALGELNVGAGVGIRDMVFIGIGTGLGIGVVINGALHHGVAGRAGELGLIGYPPDGDTSLEVAVSGEGLRKRHVHAGGSGAPADAFAEAERDAEPGTTVVREFLDDLVWVLGVVTTMLDPERIILGGGIGLRCSQYIASISQSLERRLGFAPQVVAADLGEDAGLIGAVGAALEPARRVQSWLEPDVAIRSRWHPRDIEAGSSP